VVRNSRRNLLRRPKGIKSYRGGKKGINTEVYTRKRSCGSRRWRSKLPQARRKVNLGGQGDVLESSELWRQNRDRGDRNYSDVRLSTCM